jgi:hypothetical protein
VRITVHNSVTVSADVTVEQVEAHMIRAGRCTYLLPLVPDGGELNAENIVRSAINLLAAIEDRQPGDVLADIVGHDILDRGAAIVRRNSAMARVVEARDALSRIPQHRAEDREAARARLVQAETEAERATRSLRAAEGAMK